MKQRFSIAVFPGDGIGDEIMPPCLALLTRACELGGHVALDCTTLPAGARTWQRTGEALPAASMTAARASDAILLAAMGDPAIRYPDGTEITPQLDLRFELELYAGLRPVRSIPGVAGPLADPRAANIDLVLVRESIEGLFAPQAPGTLEADGEARETLVITRRICEKLFRLSARLAVSRARDRALAADPALARESSRARPRDRASGRGSGRASGRAVGTAGGGTGTRTSSQPAGETAMSEDAYMVSPARLTCIDKANVFGAFAFFRKIFHEVAGEFELRADHAYVDIMALNLVTRPWEYDVMVTENMFGDILSDLGAALIGGMGYAPSADIGDEHAVFQPCHGSAPDIAGSGQANPTAMFLSAAMMLDWLGQKHRCQAAREAGERLRAAVDDAFRDGELVTCERGGQAGTAEVTAAVRAALDAAA